MASMSLAIVTWRVIGTASTGLIDDRKGPLALRKDLEEYNAELGDNDFEYSLVEECLE